MTDAATRERRLFGLCIYCGHPCSGLACRGHRDLLAIDANTYALRLRATSPEGAVST